MYAVKILDFDDTTNFKVLFSASDAIRIFDEADTYAVFEVIKRAYPYEAADIGDDARHASEMTESGLALDRTCDNPEHDCCLWGS